MTIYPTDLQRVGDQELRIQWSDGQQRQYRVGELRAHCPCAMCREEHGDQESAALPVLSAQQAAPLQIASMKPVGNYAYRIAFSDGHDTGLYTFELLRSLGQPVS